MKTNKNDLKLNPILHGKPVDGCKQGDRAPVPSPSKDKSCGRPYFGDVVAA